VKEIVDSGKNVVEVVEPEIIRENFINPDYLQIVREGMRRAVTAEDAPHASCKILNDLPVAVASKTGTAQTSAFEHYHNWISVFAPYDEPQIVMTIMIENVDKQMATVIPTAKEILKWYFTEDVKVPDNIDK
jgi:penicillin-binding protein 2